MSHITKWSVPDYQTQARICCLAQRTLKEVKIARTSRLPKFTPQKWNTLLAYVVYNGKPMSISKKGLCHNNYISHFQTLPEDKVRWIGPKFYHQFAFHTCTTQQVVFFIDKFKTATVLEHFFGNVLIPLRNQTPFFLFIIWVESIKSYLLTKSNSVTTNHSVKVCWAVAPIRLNSCVEMWNI